jgi:hypothetical protein
MTDPGGLQAPETPVVLAVGDVVADRYRIDAVLGEGGVGVVYRAQHLHLRKPLALKVLLPLWSSMPEIVERFEREAIAAGRIQSPHVAAATDFGRLPNGSCFLVMEYVNGRTLREALKGGALAPARALRILGGIVSALNAAHTLGIVHRDMKPENIMLIARDGDPDFVKVLDFGIAKVDGVGSGIQAGSSKVLTQVGVAIGTPEYMAPEQAMGQPVDARSDLYSVGVILFEMLTGRYPFSGGALTVLRQHILCDVPELPTDLARGIDPNIGAMLRKLLAKLPENRFASTAELIAALDECSKAALPAPPDPSRPSLEPLQAMTTPVAQRVRRSVLGGVRTLEGIARRTLDDPRALLAYAERALVAIRSCARTGRAIMVAAARRALADPKALLRYAMQKRLTLGALLAGSAGAIMIAMVVRARTRTTPSIAAEQATADSAPSIVSEPMARGTSPRSWVHDAQSVASGDAAPESPVQAVSTSTGASHETRLTVANGSTLNAGPSPTKPAGPASTASGTKPPPSFRPPPTPASPPANSCTPPYRVDFFGNKVAKPGCP